MPQFQEERQMNFEDEKDYIMRIIKEAIQALFSFLLGKEYRTVEPEVKNKYEVSGKTLRELLDMTDDGDINEAENILLGGIDYHNKEQVAAAALFYEHLSEKEERFLRQNHYSREEILDGLKGIMKHAGGDDLLRLLDD